MQRLRALPQGAAAPRRGVLHRRARPHDGARPGGRAARSAHLNGPASGTTTLGVLLAGGVARRFGGRPKGLATLGGVRIADRALDALRGATAHQLVVANEPAAPDWFPGEAIAPDEVPGMGPLGGLATALAAAAGRGVLVLAWDMPFVPTALLVAIRQRGESLDAPVAPVHGSGRWTEPLCAWYPPSSLASCRALLARGVRRAGALLQALPRAEWMDDEALAPFGDIARMFTSVDTPETLFGLGGSDTALPG